MAAAGSSMLYSFLLFVATLSLQEMYRSKLASSELFTILGGFTSSLIFLLLLTFIGNYQETNGIKTGWGTGKCGCFVDRYLVSKSIKTGWWFCICHLKRGTNYHTIFSITSLLPHNFLLFSPSRFIFVFYDAVIIAEVVALVAASTVHRVCITTCFLFSVVLLYEVNKLSGIMLSKSESKAKRF